MAITEPEFAPPWGETITTSPNLVRPTDGFIQGGWPLSAANPTRGRFNWLLKQCHNGIRYVMTRGLPNWSSSDDSYPAGAVVRDTFTDGAGFTRRSFYYLHGTAVTGTAPHSDPTNWSLIADMPIGQATNWAREIWAWRNSKQQRRFGISRLGFPAGLITTWEEDWTDITFTPELATGSGPWGRRWKFQVGITGGTLAGGGLAVSDAGAGGSPGSPTPVLTINPFPTAGGTAWILVEGAVASINVNSDTNLEMAWQGQPGGTSFSCGLANTSQIGLSAESTNLQGMAIVKRAADTNYQLYTNVDGATPVFTNTGIATGTRFQLEYSGANVADGGTARVVAFIDGVPTTLATAFGTSFTLSPCFLRPFFRGRNTTNVTSPGILGLVHFRANLNAGDNFL